MKNSYIYLLYLAMLFASFPSMAQEQPIFPEFPQPADTLDAIYYDSKELSGSEVVMLSTLQGHINTTQPRIYLLKHSFGGRTEWADRCGFDDIARIADIEIHGKI